MDKLIEGLNPAQRDAVTSPASVLQVLAPPGSGKTKTLTARVAHLITQCGLKPWDIIVCTFTVKAANEMKERIQSVVGEQLGKKLILGTFHSVSRRFLVSYGHHIGIEKNFGIADSSDQKAILTRIIKSHDLTIAPGAALGRISSLKAKNTSCDVFAATVKKDVSRQELSIVYMEYEEKLRSANLLDYDDLLLRCAFLLRTYPQCVSNIKAVLIDEFQDTNNVQYDLMTLFAQRNKAITIVGDPDQSIYGWRSAEILNLKRMQEQYPDTLVINLEENYRSTGAILASAQKVIEQDETRPAKCLQATHTIGEKPVLRKLPAAGAEADWLVAEIKRTQALSGGLLGHCDYAVLLRSAALSRQIETAFGREGIPYRMVGGTKFFDRVEVKIILDYLRVINQPEHNDALLRIINVPARNIGEKTVKTLFDEAEASKVSLWKTILDAAQGNLRASVKVPNLAQKGIGEFTNLILTARKKLAGSEGGQLTPDELVDYVLKRTRFENFLRTKYPDDCETRWANVEELKAQTADLTAAIARGEDPLESEVLPEVEGLKQQTMTIEDDALSVFLANIALSSEKQKTAEETESLQCVTISTMHAAKGLEWPVVFIPACYEGSIPHSRAEDNDEERRLLYVGMTRAQTLLYLSCPMKSSQAQETMMSRFLTQKGVEAHFEPQGPKLEYYALGQLAKTLRRDCPPLEQLEQSRKTLDLREDTYWPLDGTRPLEESAKWNGRYLYGSDQSLPGNQYALKRRRTGERAASPTRPATFVSAASVTTMNNEGFSTATSTMKPSFMSASSRMEELQAQEEEAKLKRIDQRAREQQHGKAQEPKTKKNASSLGNIMNYFGKPAGSAAARNTQPSQPLPKAVKPSHSARPAVKPLHDISNNTLFRPEDQHSEQDLPTTKVNTSYHKPRIAPLLTRPRKGPSQEPAAERPDYVFLSSSPPQPTSPTRDVAKPAPTSHLKQTTSVQTGFRPASTFHTTSMASLAANKPPVRKTLGMRRSLHGWPPQSAKK
ncbi:ATP-dependent DNA helicase srs2 [Zalaria obscura]|uniref:ATP-dependent DNA helicase srs2 n=1 Tax=Zalaria obscura TaxID=2024903 RepID=A0ACC3S4E5_9PEZI